MKEREHGRDKDSSTLVDKMRSAVLQLFVVAAVVNLQGTFAAGCDCLNTTWPAAALNAKKLPLDYGKYCAAWEDGDATKHSVGNLTTCHEMWPDMVVDDWCCQPWCFVNKTTCPDAVMSSVDPVSGLCHLCSVHVLQPLTLHLTRADRAGGGTALLLLHECVPGRNYRHDVH